MGMWAANTVGMGMWGNGKVGQDTKWTTLLLALFPGILTRYVASEAENKP